jgi:hypothetical protein
MLPIFVLVLAGCAPVSGVITGTSGSRVGSMPPDIQFVSADGWSSSFDWARCPIAIVAFTSPEGSACCRLDPQMANLADQLADLPVTVAQVSLPQGERPGSQECPEIRHVRKSGMIFLYDAERIAWNAYGQPNPGALFLIGQDGHILMTGSLEDAEPILQETRRLGQEEQKQRQAEEGFIL